VGARRAPNKIQSALGIIRAEVFAEAVRTGHTAVWHPRQFWRHLLYVRHDEHAERAVITAQPEAHMAIVILTRLDLLTPE
jgi:hypothetical protein